jgi:bifunctional UDP-N-acetylglucosamine pyrophosphorylase/glucosamine-1-phosphate N-acetyltransferase
MLLRRRRRYGMVLATIGLPEFRIQLDMAENAAIVLAAGKGKRMQSSLPKPLHNLAGRPMISHVLAGLASIAPARTVVVVAPEQADEIARAAPGAILARQERQRGTGDAVKAAARAMAGFSGDILVLFADTPLIRPETLEAMLAIRRSDDDPAVVVLGFRPADTARYGRLVTDADGSLLRIVEHADADAELRRTALCNGGAMAFDGGVLFDLLAGLRDDNAQGEFLLTDVVALARSRGRAVRVVEAGADEVMGIDTREALAKAEAVIQRRLRSQAMQGGANLIAPDTVFLSWDTRLGRDVVVHPNVVFGPGVEIGAGVEILPFSHLEGCRIAAHARIGPFARLRPGAEIGPEAHIGNFVEVKAASVEAGAKVNHLSYIGDARIGARTNIGAGTITCNYDGFNKSLTEIGADVFIGSNTALVAPVKVGDGAIVGAGSVITAEVPADALALTRAPQEAKPGFAARYRARKLAQTSARKTARRQAKQ